MGRTDVHADGTGPGSRDESDAPRREGSAGEREGSAEDDESDAADEESSGAADESATADDEPFSEPIERALAALRAGEPVCVHDFDDREGETDLFYPAAAVDTDAVARLRTDAGGLVCVALGDAVAAAADLPLFADAVDHPAVETTDLAYGDRSSFSLTVNHRDTYTGVTDADRALTIAELGGYAAAVASGDVGDGAAGGDGGDTSSDTAAGADDDTSDGAVVGDADETNDDPAAGAVADSTATFADAFRVPGHVHLLRGAPGGLAERRGHTELALALARAAGVAPAVVVCEMLDDDSGEALSVEDARAYANCRDVPFLEGERIVDELV